MAAIVLFFIFQSPGFDSAGFLQVIKADNKLKILKLGFNFKEPDILILAVLNGVFGSLASFGTDYEMMQRLLTLETRKESQKSLFFTIIATFLLVIMYLTVGTAIYVFLKINFIQYMDNSDKIVSYFAVNFLPSGIKGFVFLTIFLASIDLPLVSLSTSFVNDIYRNISKNSKEIKLIRLSRISMIFFACALGAVAYISRHVEGMLWFAFEINGVTTGSLLGVFLLGIFTSVNNSKSVVVCMILSSIVCLSFMILNKMGIIRVPWSSFVVIGTILSFAIPLIIHKITNIKN
ncbi:MAG: hypothetical protein K6357_00500 [Elusimicrobiota bacterium]